MKISFFRVDDTLKRTFELVRKSGAFCTGSTLKNKKDHFVVNSPVCNPDKLGYNIILFVVFMVIFVYKASHLHEGI